MARALMRRYAPALTCGEAAWAERNRPLGADHQKGRRGRRVRTPVPRFAANLAYLFTERPFMERFGAAAAAGFTAVELQFPYDESPSAVKAELERHRLTMLGINTPPGNTAGGEFGLAAVPGREREFELLFRQALD